MATGKSFKRTMTKSSPRCVTIPAEFFRNFGSELNPEIGLVMHGDIQIWKVKINSYMMKDQRHVSFGRGWTEFMRSNFIVEGDRIQFNLLPNSIFRVQRVRQNGASVREILGSSSNATILESPSIAEMIRRVRRNH